MTAARPSYAPVSPRAGLSRLDRLGLRLRGRARRRWSDQALLDERAEMLKLLDALEETRARFATRARNRVVNKPSAHLVVEEVIRRGQARFDRGAELLRHRLVLCDGVLSAKGVRPWVDEERRLRAPAPE